MSMALLIIEETGMELKTKEVFWKMKKEEDKAERVLSIYTRLIQGEIINKEEESFKFGVATRTIQRNIADIQNFLRNQCNETGEIQEVVFDKKYGGYRLETKVQKQLTPGELLAVCKVLLESRALVKDEMFPVIHKLLFTCGAEHDRKQIQEYIRNEMHHYVELNHHKKLIQILWELEKAVKEQRYVEISYIKLKKAQRVRRKVKPVGIMFSEFYYYLTAFIEDIDKEKEFQNPDDLFPTIYRVDRLTEVKILEEHFPVPYRERFEEGEFRKRIQFMYGGRLKKIRFKYRGNSLESVLDRLPTAKVIRQEGEAVLVQAEVFGDGVERWIKTQGDDIYDLERVELT